MKTLKSIIFEDRKSDGALIWIDLDEERQLYTITKDDRLLFLFDDLEDAQNKLDELAKGKTKQEQLREQIINFEVFYSGRLQDVQLALNAPLEAIKKEYGAMSAEGIFDTW